MSSVALAIADGAVVAKRNLIKIKRVPEILIWITMSPIMFVLLFAYVFGSNIPIPGVSYREFLMGGIFVQTVIFGATFTGAGLAEDMTKGIIDRFRSLPMARSAVLVGRTGSDIFYNSASIFVMSVTGLIVGWRIRTGVREAIGNTGAAPPDVWSLQNPIAYTIIWVGIILAIFVPLSVQQYNKASSRV